MSFINTIPAAKAEGEVREMYERQQGFWGFVPDYARVFCYRPQLMERWGRMLAEIKRPVDPRRLEMVTFVVAHELKHSSCSLAHGAALARIISKEAVMAIANGESHQELSEKDWAIMTFARQIALDAALVGSDDIKSLREVHGLSDAEIFDIAAIAASRSFFTKLLDALGASADRGFLELDEDLRHTLTVGRPISREAPERVPEENSV